MRKPEATKYVNAIRNKEKKRYAVDYHNALINKTGPDSVNDDNYNFSYMAKQCVRMQLNKFYND